MRKKQIFLDLGNRTKYFVGQNKRHKTGVVKLEYFFFFV